MVFSKTAKCIAVLLAAMLVFAPYSVSALRGDLDGGGTCNARDYMKLKRFVLDTHELSQAERRNADMDGDGSIDAKDYMMLKRMVLGTYSDAPDMKNDPAWEIMTLALLRINDERQKNGLQPLVLSAELCLVAHDKSCDMAQNGYFDHTSPIYGDPADMLDDYGVQYRVSGENIAAGQQTVAEVVSAWMNSPGHRANILNPSFSDMGIGLCHGGEYGIYWTLVLCG